MRVLVTGAKGFLGSAVAERLTARAEVIACGRGDAPAGGFVLDLADPAAVRRALERTCPDVVVNAAGRHGGSPVAMLADNALATANLAAAMAAVSPSAGLVLLGSAAQYGAAEEARPWRETDACLPQTPYGLSKLVGEQCALALARRQGLKVAALRLFNVVSPKPAGEQALATFLRRAAAVIASGPPPWRVRLGPLSAVRDFVALDDVLAAIERVIDRSAWGEAINVCTGVGRPVRALIEAAAAQISAEVVIDEASGDGGVAWSVGDPARCQARLGFVPSSDLVDVARQAAAWIIAKAGGAHARSGA